jgi:hypothetical protein
MASLELPIAEPSGSVIAQLDPYLLTVISQKSHFNIFNHFFQLMTRLNVKGDV